MTRLTLDSAEISDQARKAARQHDLIEDGADMTMRDAETPLVVLGQGDSRRTVEADDLDETWLDVLIVACILIGLATIFVLLRI